MTANARYYDMGDDTTDMRDRAREWRRQAAADARERNARTDDALLAECEYCGKTLNPRRKSAANHVRACWRENRVLRYGEAR